jgi:hypothetical protein
MPFLERLALALIAVAGLIGSTRAPAQTDPYLLVGRRKR